ncbi:kinase-like domain-containing protein [Mycena epipterygia]|nr:kinase-like domain-containing protein [Mycena epipterygia]
MTTPLLPPYPTGWPTSGRSEDLFRFVVEHVSKSLSDSLPSPADSAPWVSSSSSSLERAIVKRPRIDSLEVDGRMLSNEFDLYGVIDGVGLVIQAIDGVRLDAKIEARPFPSDSLKLEWANQLIRAIHHIHSFGLSHGDISPGNVLIDTEGNVKLIDFGRSARAGEELFPASHPFTAPDNMHSSHDPSLSDSYALGVLLLCLERNEILEDMVMPGQLAGMHLPLFGHLILRYTAEDRHARSKIDLNDVLAVPGSVDIL